MKFKASNCGTLAVASLVVCACSTAQFKGNTPGFKKPATEAPANPNPNSNPANPEAGQPGEKPGDKPGTTPAQINPNVDPNKPGVPPTQAKIPDDPGQTPTVDWGKIVDIFKPILGTPDDKPIDPILPDINTIDFRPAEDGQVFHIGDNEMDNSSCLVSLSAKPLSGVAFYFDFEVPESPTVIQIEVTDICGVDYETNTLVLTQDGVGTIKSGRVPVGRGRQGRADIDLGVQTLKPGKYTLKIESIRNPDKVMAQTPAGDRDDFIVGHVRVHADKKLNKIGYHAGAEE